MKVKLKYVLIIIGLFILCHREISAQEDQLNQAKKVALMNGKAHLGNGESIENSVITIENGKINLVADARLVRLDLTGYKVIDIFGKHVYLIERCSKNKRKKCFKIVNQTQERLLTELQPANLVVLTQALTQPESSLVYVITEGKCQPVAPYTLANHRLFMQ